MGEGWQFTDDRGVRMGGPRTPLRIVAYLQAGAALHDLGLRPAGLFGSQHDGKEPDPVKAGGLPVGGIPYFGAGGALDVDALLASGPELVVAVGYGGDAVYGIAAEAAERLAREVPLAVLGVGADRSLAELRGRFAELAAALGAAHDPVAEDGAVRAAEELAAAADPAVRVLALSAADGESAYLARPGAWPDLRELAAQGVAVVEPAGSAGVNWATASWAEAAALRPRVVLADARTNAASGAALGAAAGWQELCASATVLPWNPELPPTAHAHAAFLRMVASALGSV